MSVVERIDSAIIDHVFQPVAHAIEDVSGMSCYRLAAHLMVGAAAALVMGDMLNITRALLDGDTARATFKALFFLTIGTMNVLMFHRDYRDAIRLDEKGGTDGVENPLRLKRLSIRMIALAMVAALLPIEIRTLLTEDVYVIAKVLNAAWVPLLLLGQYFLVCSTGGRRRVKIWRRAAAGV